MKIPILAALFLASIGSAFAAEPLQFIPATPKNTTLADGNAIATKEGVWKWLPGEGNQGVLESTGDPVKNAPPLVITAKGLESGRDYEVFGFFWTHGFGPAPAGREKQSHHWPARFGFGLASMTVFGGKHHAVMPWLICPESKISQITGNVTVLEEKDPLVKGVQGWVIAKDDLRLIRARLGVARSDTDGTLSVFADDFPDSIHCGRTMIDGIGVRLAPPDLIATAGAGTTNALHMALRARDTFSVKREIQAGADVNALDSFGFCPLFHPAAMGDRETVEILLSAGADPNVAGQSIPVLTAAASTGDAAMARLLIDAGAKVPEGRIPVPSWLPGNADSSALHPAIAAIGIGSLDTLKILLEQNPGLRLESLGPSVEEYSGPKPSWNPRPSSLYLVEEAMSKRHDETAAFLIDRGCTLRSKIFMTYEHRRREPYEPLVVRAITEGKALAKTREAIFRRGFPLIVPRIADAEGIYSVRPWDGLSAAVSTGDLALTQKLLPQASGVNGIYQDRLLALAWWTGQPEILSMVQKQFPDSQRRNSWAAPAEHNTGDAEGLRLLLPRTRSAPVRNKVGDEWVLACIPATNAEGPAALLEVSAADQPGWKVMDRQNIKAALSETGFANPWAEGEHRLAELGDHIAADLLILVSSLKGKDMQLLRFEAVDVATGLPFMREHIDAKMLNDGDAIGSMLARIRSAFESARAGKRPKAITMLPFSVGDDVANSGTLANLFRSAIHAEVDATPGLLSVGMAELKAISNEQDLKGEGNLWAAAFTLEGGVATEAGGGIKLTLRLRNTLDAAGKFIDVSTTGEIGEITNLVDRAFRKLLESNHLGDRNEAHEKSDPRQAAAEASRLMREGEWLMNTGMPSEAVPLFERAALLGFSSEQLVTLHLRALAHSIPLLDGGLDLLSPASVISDHPLNLDRQRRLCHGMGEIRAYLDQAAYYESRFGKQTQKWERDIFWHSVIQLSFLRASLPRCPDPDIPMDAIQNFGDELDRFTAEYFKTRASMRNPRLPTSRASKSEMTTSMLKRNPELLKGWISMFLLCSVETSDKTPYGWYSLFGEPFDTGEYGGRHWYGMTTFLANEIRRRMDEYKGPRKTLRDAELTCIIETDDRQSNGIRTYLGEWTKLSRRDYLHLPRWLGTHRFQFFGIARLMERANSGVTHHEGEMLASLVHEPLGSLDWISHPLYDYRIRSLVSIEEMTPSVAEKYLDNFRPLGDYDRLARAASELPGGKEELGRLAGGIILWERIHGFPISKSWHEKWSRLFQSNQEPDHGLRARLLTDLRAVDNSMPGSFMLPTYDSVNRNRMWVHFQSYEDKPSYARSQMHSSAVRRQPWLVGFDCITGEINRRVNLSNGPGLDPGSAAATSLRGYHQDDGFIVQTNEQILTGVLWPGMDENRAKVKEASFLINKSDGKMTPLENGIIVGAPMDKVNSTKYSVGAVAIDKEFFVLHEARHIQDQPRTRYVPFELSRISPDGKVSPLTVIGRRPELSPFDPKDRLPRMIFRDGGNLLVIHEWDHLGRYDPKQESWIMDEADPNKKKASARALVSQDYRKHIFPSHNVKGEKKDDKTYVIRWDLGFPDKLAFYDPSKRELRVGLELEIPDNFRNQPIMAGPIVTRTGQQHKFGTYDQPDESHKYCIVVLNQTKDDIILGLQFGGGYKWYPGKRVGLFLPLVWALPKEDFLAAAAAASATKITNPEKK